MARWEYLDAADSPSAIERPALLALLASGALPIETRVRRAGAKRWRSAALTPAFERALYPHGVGAALPSYDAPEAAARPRSHYPPPRPWVRFWARVIDVTLFSAALRAGVAAAGWTPGIGGESAIGFATLLGWVVFEALAMTVTGTTPGKALLRVRVRRCDGRRPGFEAALTRAFDVWFRGLAMGIPLAILVTELVAYRRLVGDGVTTWDRTGDLMVSHGPIGAARIAAAIALVALAVTLAVELGDA